MTASSRFTDTDTIKALTFDVFGTLVDWYTTIATEGRALGARHRLTADWSRFALDWRAGYGPAMQRVNQGELAWQPLDSLHRMILDSLADTYGLDHVPESELRDLNLAWHRLQAWPDVRAGIARLRRRFLVAPLSNGNVALLVDLARCNGLEWDCVLSSELARRYKPRPEVYETAAQLLALDPAQIMMVAAHEEDLVAARAAGFRTAYVSRPAEFGPDATPSRDLDAARRQGFDLHASDLNDLADQLGTA